MLRIGMSIMLILVFCFNSKSQDSYVVSEDTKMLLFSSVENDGTGATKGTLDEWMKFAQNRYEYFDIEFSPRAVFYKPSMSDSISGEYELRLYKLLSVNSEHQSRFVIWYKDFSSEVWLRVGGYVENDLHLLFDYLKVDKINKKMLKGMLQNWVLSDPLFGELDWDCLLKGYIKNSTRFHCFKSAYYIFVNDTSVGFDPLKEDQLNAGFSRMPLYGRFERY